MFQRMITLVLALTTPTILHAAEQSGEVMLVGTYHLANNNRDLLNVPVEDVLSERRQQEIERLVDGFARWHPTQVAIEWPRADQSGLNKRYSDYLAGNLKLTANERDQIAFRLAKKLRLSRIDAIDWNDAPPGPSSAYDFAEWAKANGQADRFNSFIKDGQAEANRTALDMRQQTVTQWYRTWNDPLHRMMMHKAYFTIASFGTNDENPGAAWVGSWYARDLRIFNNIREKAGLGQRVFVLYGAGHTYLLSRFLAESKAAALVDPRRFMPAR